MCPLQLCRRSSWIDRPHQGISKQPASRVQPLPVHADECSYTSIPLIDKLMVIHTGDKADSNLFVASLVDTLQSSQ